MLIKRKRIIECNIFKRTKGTDILTRCTDCNKFLEILHICSLSTICDKVNKGLHSYSGLKYVI